MTDKIELPVPIEESWFYRADDTQCYCSNAGIGIIINELQIVRIYDLHSYYKRKINHKV